jgi:glycosyltransferase involved in cell wall biosynthesis
MMRNILFVSHDASRSGAPIILLNLIIWLKINKNVNPVILLLEAGPLYSDFVSIGEVFVYEKEVKRSFKKQNFLIRFLKRCIYKENVEYESMLSKIHKKDICIIYSNTVSSNWVLPEIKKVIDVPVLNHIHEMYTSIVTYYPEMLSDEIKKNINHFLFVTDLNLKNILANYQIPQEKSTIISEFIDISKIDRLILSKKEFKQKEETEKMTVYSCGKMSFRKGKDYFFEVVKTIAFEFPEIQLEFVWLGEIDHEYVKYIELDFQMNGKEKNFKIMDSVLDPINAVKNFDLMLLLSREDPFPLVAIEAAILSKPIIIFQNASGVENTLIYGEHQISEYGNVGQVVNKIINFYQNPHLMEITGKENHQNAQKFDINIVGEKINVCINSLITKNKID